MLSKEEFVKFILEGPEAAAPSAKSPEETALPAGFEGFDDVETSVPAAEAASSFARRLLEASGFGYAAMVQRSDLIRGNDPVARHLPERVSYWPKTLSRPYQTLLFEADLNNKQLLAIPAFKSRKMAHLDIVEDALARLVSEALEGFQRGGEGVTADVRKGRKEETLCVVSIIDEREGQPVRLVCFGTQNKSTGGLETFQLSERARFLEPQLARDLLGLLYERQFKKLEGGNWQDAFTTTEERKQAEKLLGICTRKAPGEHDIQEGVLDLLDIIAKGFALRKPPGRRRLQAYALPSDHDIGIDPEERENSFGGKNPFGGVTLRDERSRLLGYIIYPLKTKSDATRLRSHLEKNNRFHNVLVVYPDQDQASLELWQGQEQLIGKLRKGQGYKDAADVVNLLSRFFVVSKAKVRNPTELAQELAYRARYLRRLAVKQLAEEPKEGPLRNLYNAFKEALVHDQTEEEFADAFAQTITYGLLTARWTGNDELMANGERLTRQTAVKHLPAASPFLNDLFKATLSVKLDEQRGRLLWLVDDIADLLDRIDVTYIFGVGDKDSDTATDPVIHFYEPFLAAYDKELKNKRGVFFTPRPVVSYIVFSVHELLQKEFGLEDGLASIDTWGDVAKRIKGLKIPKGVKASDRFVCILDPATGTGTFLYECIEVIERTMKERWCKELKKGDWRDPEIISAWNKYVTEHLLPRLHGYELMMAPYAVAHLKLTFKLAETGYARATSERLSVYLTNSLDPPSATANPKLAGLFETLGKEAQEVIALKHLGHFTVVVGNPPYALLSSNLEAAHRAMIEPYKQVAGERIREKGALQLEKNLNDDYVKFIRLGQVTLDRSGAGVSGMITNHSFLDNPTMRGLRWNLMNSVAQIFVIDLHGNTTKKEQCPDGGADVNVFQIKQGVAISLLVKRPMQSGCEVRHHECWGTREDKDHWLAANSCGAHSWTSVDATPDLFLFVPQSAETKAEFSAWPSLPEIMSVNGAGYITARDNLVIDFDHDVLIERIRKFKRSRLDDESLLKDFEVSKKKGWDLSRARKDLRRVDIPSRIIETNYRPFDTRWIFFDGTLVWGRSWPTMQHLVGDKYNLSLLATRMTKDQWDVWVARTVSSHKAMSAYDTNSVFPLFLCDDIESRQARFRNSPRRGNISEAFATALASVLSGGVSHEPKPLFGLDPEEVFAYAYAVFRSPEYRKRYAEFLKSEFPRLPCPCNAELFYALAAIGKNLIGLHLLEAKLPVKLLPQYINKGRPEVEKASFSNSTIWINRERSCGFSGVTEDVWQFRVGGYQVCNKWMKDRKGRTLSKDDVEYYQKIVAAISETIRMMKEIDEVIDKHGGWPDAFVTKPPEGRK